MNGNILLNVVIDEIEKSQIVAIGCAEEQEDEFWNVIVEKNQILAQYLSYTDELRAIRFDRMLQKEPIFWREYEEDFLKNVESYIQNGYDEAPKRVRSNDDTLRKNHAELFDYIDKQVKEELLLSSNNSGKFKYWEDDSIEYNLDQFTYTKTLQIPEKFILGNGNAKYIAYLGGDQICEGRLRIDDGILSIAYLESYSNPLLLTAIDAHTLMKCLSVKDMDDVIDALLEKTKLVLMPMNVWRIIDFLDANQISYKRIG